MSESSEQSRELMRRITTEIWDAGRLDLIDEYIAEDLIDHIEVPGLEVTGRVHDTMDMMTQLGFAWVTEGET
jgi:hypothetical protein